MNLSPPLTMDLSALLCLVLPVFRIRGSGFRVLGSRFRVQDSGFRIQSSGFRVLGAGFRVLGAVFKVQGSGFRVSVPTWRCPRHKPSIKPQQVSPASTLNSQSRRCYVQHTSPPPKCERARTPRCEGCSCVWNTSPPRYGNCWPLARLLRRFPSLPPTVSFKLGTK